MIRKPVMYVNKSYDRINLYLVNDYQTLIGSLSVEEAEQLMDNLWEVLRNEVYEHRMASDVY